MDKIQIEHLMDKLDFVVNEVKTELKNSSEIDTLEDKIYDLESEINTLEDKVYELEEENGDLTEATDEQKDKIRLYKRTIEVIFETFDLDALKDQLGNSYAELQTARDQ